MKLDIQKVTFAYVFLFLFALSQEANIKAQKSLFSMLKATYKQNETEEKNNSTTKISGWMSISSDLFMNRNRYPPFKPFQVEVGAEGKRKNVNYFSKSKNEGAHSQFDFWFKLNNGYLYYYLSKEDKTILDAILIKQVRNERENCFMVTNYANEQYHLCANEKETKLNFLCDIQNQLQLPLDFSCPNQNSTPSQNEPTVRVNRIKKTVIVIPTASRMCNENWNYKKFGTDWECTCSEGAAQSPINLPDKLYAVENNTVPQFAYDIVKSSDISDSNPDNFYIKYEDGAIKIKSVSKSFGKILLNDGSIYSADEIIFHTPSEHMINNKRYDMEMQIIHHGISKGDISKQFVVAFLFKSDPGVYNKFMNDIDYKDLPNKIDRVRILKHSLYIPDIFNEPEDPRSNSMPPFSFYFYSGSISAPPCTERTTVLVASEPIPLSPVVIGLFKDALNAPDMIDEVTETLIVSNEEKVDRNYREVQPLNDRVVYYFDNEKFGCPAFKKKKNLKKQTGHFEKRMVEKKEIIYVSGNKPSGIPGALVIDENEVKK